MSQQGRLVAAGFQESSAVVSRVLPASARAAPQRCILARLPWFRAIGAAILAVALMAEWPVLGGVVINELMAGTSERLVSWGSNGVPRLGSGARWMEPEFSTAGWSNAVLPAGYGFTGLATDLTSQMKDKAPSLYLVREFQATAAQAASGSALALSVQYNDGFVAWLNGRELARANCGASNSFLFAMQPAFNVNTNTNVVSFTVGPASGWLVAGRNVLALEAHNAEQPSTSAEPELITQHLPTPEFRINAGLALSGGGDFITWGPGGGPWLYFVGVVEPSGGVVDLGLATKPFVPPAGEEDDYDPPAAFGDWVELYNNGATAVSLAGWGLTDDPAALGKWHFPTNALLSPGGYLVVMCDNRDEANAPAGPGTRWHTNFKLGASGEYVGLTDSLGHLVDGVSFPAQVYYAAYGRNPTNASTFGFLSYATPGASNTGLCYTAQVALPQFQDLAGNDLAGGLYHSSSLSLYLRDATPGSVIRYTLDATEPTETNGALWTTALVLSQPNSNTGIVVRARAFVPGLLPSEVQTHSYLLKQPSALTNSPVFLVSGDAGRTFYAPNGVLATVGGYRVGVDNGSIWQPDGPQSYTELVGAGIPFERKVHVEYYFPPAFYPTNQPPVRCDAGLRLSSSSWSRPRLTMYGAATNSPWQPWWDPNEKPSFNLYFTGDYGPGKLDYQLFTNYPVNNFQHLRLRAGKNDLGNPSITDELVRRLWIDTGQVGSRGLYCTLYVNAVYKGVYNLCERIREPFFQAHCQSDLGWDVDYSWTWVDGDNSVFLQLLSALDQNLTNLVNWSAVTNKLEIDNAADYYLLNIYCAMWDWPENNFVIARERSTNSLGRFRFAVWDAEGAFNVVGYAHPVDYNTITSDLSVPPADDHYWLDVARIFRRLATAPEFRLRFADRVNRHMFNGGVLDDRDPDGAGPLKSRFGRRLDELVQEAGALVQYDTGYGLNTSAYTAWTSATAGRRTYLLGNTAGHQMLRDAGLWPPTEPPIFSQFGGAVPNGYSLTMTSVVATAGQTANIYYSIDGTDPRRTGGGLSPQARLYSGPISISQVVTVKARARNTSNTAEWSALTEATFALAPVPASASNLVLAELMYHPPDVSAAEAAAGFSDADDFEFARLLNIGPAPVDLAGVKFTIGVTFDFNNGAIRFLNPGANVLVVKRRIAFQARYGHGCDGLIAGEYSGNFSNGGERVQILGTNGVVIRDFAYGDQAPWPAAADGDGPSLVLWNPTTNPDPGNPLNWTASAVPGGLPSGAATPQTYSTWRALFWDSPATFTNNAISGPSADPDGDGLCNFLEYALGLDPNHSSSRPAPVAALELVNGQRALTISIRAAPSAQDAKFTWQTSSDLQTWAADNGTIQLLATNAAIDGSAVLKYADTTPPTQASRYLRLRIAGP